MYGIIHKEIFDSTLMAEGYEVAYVMMAMVTLANEYDVCSYGEVAFANRINMPLHKLRECIRVLSQPEWESKSQEYEGKRIVPLSEMNEIESNRGWFVVNRKHYIELAKRENRKEANKRYYGKAKKSELSENGGIKTEKVLKDSDSDDVKTHININVLKEAASGDNPKNFIWEEALKFKGITRTFLGKLCKEYSEDNLVKAIIRTKEYCPADPKSFLVGVLMSDSTDFEKGAI